eukprot:CAMPEP_0198537864 /NCGR_PEP_ID=MMETSP1462-20131121/45460_1 /TAXON_ID=1333877 /ORGANISM="Brandtodinium nutriculum, Strain RCC3387" /LENGTH=156 /DNA_ID=CAMNT_0044267869 /DNA_START=9 /DNA_END=475 /DNA_ORIENTATION=+
MFEDGFDVFGVSDVCDMGQGVPVFAQWTFEDWALLGLRFELTALVHAFRRDVNDAERAGIHVDHFTFYYNRYFRKACNLKSYGVESVAELVGLVSDSVYLSPQQVLCTHLSEELDSVDIYAELTEEARRERHLQIDSGNEKAVLKFSQAHLAAPSA